MASTIIKRREDMSSFGQLILILQTNGDVVIRVQGRDTIGQPAAAEIEFCDPGAGGGLSPKTLAALKQLAEAMERDNRSAPR